MPFSFLLSMATVRVKGHELLKFNAQHSFSFNRKALQFKSNIIDMLRKIGVSENYIDVPIERFAMKNAPATALWYFEGHNLEYTYGDAKTFIENLYVVAKVIELEAYALLDEEKTSGEFIHEFSEEEDIETRRKLARETLGVSHDTTDMEIINKQYKVLAKEHHPDMPTGDTERFKAINDAHKILKRELER